MRTYMPAFAPTVFSVAWAHAPCAVVPRVPSCQKCIGMCPVRSFLLLKRAIEYIRRNSCHYSRIGVLEYCTHTHVMPPGTRNVRRRNKRSPRSGDALWAGTNADVLRVLSNVRAAGFKDSFDLAAAFCRGGRMTRSLIAQGVSIFGRPRSEGSATYLSHAFAVTRTNAFEIMLQCPQTTLATLNDDRRPETFDTCGRPFLFCVVDATDCFNRHYDDEWQCAMGRVALLLKLYPDIDLEYRATIEACHPSSWARGTCEAVARYKAGRHLPVLHARYTELANVFANARRAQKWRARLRRHWLRACVAKD